MPKINDIFASLAGDQLFTKLDLSQAYQHVALDETSQKYVVINTHLGLFNYKRLPFGVASGPAIFQRVMDTLLQDIPMTVVYLDDILVTGSCLEEHLQNLEMALQRLANSGLRINLAKCAFLQKEISYLGHTINSQGLAPDKKKVIDIQAAPELKNVTKLRSLLGMINYCDRVYRSWLQGWLHSISFCATTYVGSGKMSLRKRSDERWRFSSLAK